jgi:hypothetical protein
MSKDIKPLSERLRAGVEAAPWVCEEVSRMEADVANLRARVADQQATIDRLMLEYCPSEMSAEQMEEWGKHQRRATHTAGPVALTEGQIEEIWAGIPAHGSLKDIRHAFARAIEQHLRAAPQGHTESIETNEFADLITDLHDAHAEVNPAHSKKAWRALIAHINTKLAAAHAAGRGAAVRDYIDNGAPEQREGSSLANNPQAAQGEGLTEALDSLRKVKQWISREVPIGTTGTLPKLRQLNAAIEAIAAHTATKRSAEDTRASSDSQEAQSGLDGERLDFTEAQISAAGRVLADRSAAACGVDKGDNWAIYGNEFIEEARLAIDAAIAAKAPSVGAQGEAK